MTVNRLCAVKLRWKKSKKNKILSKIKNKKKKRNKSKNKMTKTYFHREVPQPPENYQFPNSISPASNFATRPY